MEDLLLHPRNRAELSALWQDTPHALLLAAPHGTGKQTIAWAWASKLTQPANISSLEPDEKGTITIEATRALYQRTRSKQDGWQVVIIDRAETMSGEAQNAFLKLLEEPRAGLTFVLTAPAPDALLPTIQSRLQVIHLQPLGNEILADYAKRIKPGITAQELQQLLFVANGRPALVAAMLQNANTFEQYRQIMQRAKYLLQASRYERLAMVQELCKDKIQLVATLEAVTRMLSMQLQHDINPAYLAFADSLQNCLLRLRQNGNPRAQLTHLFMSQ